MHQTRKGNQWYFGIKVHVEVDSKSKVIHSVVATATNVHDSQVLPDLPHGEETRGWGDSAYRLFATCALVNLYMVRHDLLRIQRERCVQ